MSQNGNGAAIQLHSMLPVCHVLSTYACVNVYINACMLYLVAFSPGHLGVLSRSPRRVVAEMAPALPLFRWGFSNAAASCPSARWPVAWGLVARRSWRAARAAAAAGICRTSPVSGTCGTSRAETHKNLNKEPACFAPPFSRLVVLHPLPSLVGHECEANSCWQLDLYVLFSILRMHAVPSRLSKTH